MTDYEAARFVADTENGLVLAGVDLAAPADRVFQALTSPEICDWWVRPGIFDTREWSGDVRIGGRWRSSGVGGGKPYAIEGEFLEVEPGRRLAHTWQPAGAPGKPSLVSYGLEGIEVGTRLILRHSGLAVPAVCRNTGIGWETSFTRLAELVAKRAEISA